MIDRYKVPSISTIWTKSAKLQLWLKVELAVYQAWSQINRIPSEAWTKLAQMKLKINIHRMEQLEALYHHDVVAFTHMITEQIDDPAVAKWFHYGLTSTDVVDTANHLMIQASNNYYAAVFTKLLVAVQQLAWTYQNTLIIGRTHGMYGEPISFGLKWVNFYAELKRQQTRLRLACRQVETVKLSGAMGNFTNLDPAIERIVANDLHLSCDTVSNQVAQRDRHAFLVQVFANLSTTLAKIALEIRHLHRSEVSEVAEGFGRNQKGSSAMPHKRNPVGAENISGLTRLIQAYDTVALNNNLLWHERDISHSSTERIMWPDLYHLITYCTIRLTNILANLEVNQTKMRQRILDHPEVFSQYWLNWLLQHTNLSRADAYNQIQAAFIANNPAKQAQFYAKYDVKPLTWRQIKTYYLQNLDYLYAKEFADAPSN